MAEDNVQNPPLILVHGWGFNNAMWRDVIDLLPDYECHSIELGFLLGAPQGTSFMPPNAVGVGHSFGLMWLLKHGPRPLRGLISIAGFDCFAAHIEPRQIEAMRRGLDRDPVAQMQRFWRACGTQDFTQRENYDVSALKGGLDWLAGWDEREARHELTCPLVAIGSQDDAIVPIEMTQAIWGDTDLRLRPDGGHALPLSQPQWCADEINDFVTRISN